MALNPTVANYFDVLAGRIKTAVLGASPITTAEAKRHCRVTGVAEDLDFARWVESAHRFAIAKTHRAFINSTFTYVLDCFPPDGWGIQLPRPPLSTVTSIKYTDSAGNADQVFSADDYNVLTAQEPGMVTLAYGASWPDTYDDNEAVTITYVGGYGATSASVPEEYLDDMLRYVYAHFSRVAPEVMYAVKAELFRTNPVRLVG